MTKDVTKKWKETIVEGAKSDERPTYMRIKEMRQSKIPIPILMEEMVMTDVILPQVQATQEIEDTHVTLTPVNPDGQQQSSSVSSGFVSNMLNPNQDTGVDDIFGQHTEATSLIDTPVTAIMEPSFTAQINRPPTPYPLVIQTQQPPILTPATTTSSSLQNLPNFASLFGFDYRLKALEDNFSELRQTNQYAEALSSIPGTCSSETTTKTAGKTTSTGSKTHKKSASQSASVEEVMQTTDVFETLAHQEFEKGVEEKSTKPQPKKLDGFNPEGRQYPHDLRQPLPLVPNSQGRRVIPFHHFINNDLEYLRGGVSSRKYSTSVTKTTAADYGHIKWIED
ncbi:hypothetical protein Tco_0189269 [Tanacetum coccineum]